MSRFDPVDDVPVPVGACLCPGTPHADGDVVYLAPELSTIAGQAAQGAIAASEDSARLEELLWRVYRDHCITGWNFLDADGDPVPLTSANRERGLPFTKGGRLVAEKADELYAQDVLAPLRARLDLAKKQARQLARSGRGLNTTGPKATSSRPRSTSTPR